MRKNDTDRKNSKVANDKHDSANHYHSNTNHEDNHGDMRGEEDGLNQ